MRSPRSPLFGLLAQVLIAALVLTSLPPVASASYEQPPLRGPIHADGLGSIRRLTDEAGTITDGYTYLAFGELLAHTGTDPQPYAFTGEPLDPNSGFQYHRARWMDPRVSRFHGMDPERGVISDPPSLHRYLYAANDPVLKVDPSGREYSLVTLSIASGIITGLASASITALRGGDAREIVRSGVVVGASTAALVFIGIAAVELALFRLGVGLAAGAGGVAAAGSSNTTTTLYRAMSQAEYEQLIAAGRFAAGRGSMEAKWFAEKLPNAVTWGEKLEGATFRVVEIQVRTNAYEQWYRVARLDAIGPAVVAEIPALNEALVGAVRTIR